MSGVDLEKPFARPLGDGGLDRLDDIGQAGLRHGVLEPRVIQGFRFHSDDLASLADPGGELPGEESDIGPDVDDERSRPHPRAKQPDRAGLESILVEPVRGLEYLPARGGMERPRRLHQLVEPDEPTLH